MSILSILIIDDSEADRTLYKEYLASFIDHEYSFLEAVSAEEGMLLYRKHKPDCTILDLILQGSSGTDLLEKTSDLERQLRPVVFVTGLTQSSEDTKFSKDILAMGAKTFLSKDEITPEILYEAVVDAVREPEPA